MGEVAWRVELAVKPGRLNEFRALTGEMVAAARGRAGVLSYQRFVSGDGKAVHVYERYADCAAAVAHLRMFTDAFSERFLDVVERRSFTVYGRPSAELRGLLDDLGASYFTPFGDFAYWA